MAHMCTHLAHVCFGALVRSSERVQCAAHHLRGPLSGASAIGAVCRIPLCGSRSCSPANYEGSALLGINYH